LRGRIDGIDGRRVGIALGKIAMASIVMAIAAWTIQHELTVLWHGQSPLHRIVRVGLSVSGGLATLAIAAKLLRLEEFERAFARVAGRFVGRR
jgi:peptidoglycan biosynthesis protein MviN/MurJ (putative lipid II flippase)